MTRFREALVEELGMHDTSRVAPTACLCGGWDGRGTFTEHLAEAVVSLLDHLDQEGIHAEPQPRPW